jgi:hypothetical protein
MNEAQVMVQVECAVCHGTAYRIRRQFVDRLLSLVAPRRRYRCGAIGCEWEGTVPLEHCSLPGSNEPAGNATLGGSITLLE